MNIVNNIVLRFINFYQDYLSFDHGVLAIFAPTGACKYEVSCSEYTKDAIRELGVIQGSFKGLKRIWSCR